MNSLFGGPSSRTGEGLDAAFVHSWPWPPWSTLLLLLAAVAYIVTIYFREPGDARRSIRLALAAVRISLIALVLTMMYGWMRDRYRTDLPDLALIIDDSQSMQIVDQYDTENITDRLHAQLRSIGLDELTRINLAKVLLLDRDMDWLQELRQRYNVKLYLVGESTRIRSPNRGNLREAIRQIEATQSASLLGKGLRGTLEMQRGRPTAAVLFFTDGVTTEGQSIGDVADLARRRNAPLFLVGLGDDQPARDLRVEDLLLDDVVFLGDLVHCDFKVIGNGFAAEEITVRLKQEGAAATLAEQTITLAGDGNARSMRLSYRATEEGEFRFTVQSQSLRGETNLSNNSQTQTVRVRDETVQVLFLQAYPSFEFRYLKTLLERGLSKERQEKSIQLTTVLQEADLDYVQLDETARRVFPVGREELFDYDVLIIGDANPSYLSQPVMENIAAFVMQAGGGIIFLSGPRYMPLAYRDTPLEDLFPIELDSASLPDNQQLVNQSFRVAPTRLGLRCPQMQLADTPAASLHGWHRLPAIRWLLHAPDTRSAARVLAEHPSQTNSNGRRLPVICTQFVGAGQVVFHATDESYLWSRSHESGEYYERYWIQTIRHLGRAKLLGTSNEIEVSTGASEYRRGETVPIRVRFRDARKAPASDDGVVVVVEQDAGRRRNIRLPRDSTRRGVFDGTISNLPQGSYRIWLTTPSVSGTPPSGTFDVVPPPGERARLAMDAADLQQAAEASGGKFYDITTVQRLLDDLPQGRQVRIESLPPTPIWNSPFMAGLFLILLITEWVARRTIGWL